jgi:tRNA pseudouridine32 synthase/23S rRNA pseudouridine746 synthase/23S rRNA pseudouridine1911/1915/1917 synthase
MSKKRTNTRTDARYLVFEVNESEELLSFLLKVLSNRGRNAVKSILARGQVSIDGRVTTQFNDPLTPGQTVSVLKNKEAKKQASFIGIQILFEDKDLLVIEKEAGLLSVATQKEKHRTAYHQLTNYVKKEHPRNRVFVVHRLDKDTSGVILFAKKESVKRKLQNNWNTAVKERGYVALVEGKVSRPEGTLISWLKETKSHLMYSSHKPNDGLFAKTRYTFIQGNEDFSLLEVYLETGRKNQIRVHLQDLGHPVVGDKKYGSKSRNVIGRLGLHAKTLTFQHPTTNQIMSFETDVPASFIRKSR